MGDTSESLYGIPKQPEATCHEIDKAIKKLQEGLRCLGLAFKKCKHVEGASDIASEIDSGIWDIEDMESALEHCRSQCEDIRAWGQAWKDLAKEAIERLPPEDAALFEREANQEPQDGR